VEHEFTVGDILERIKSGRLKETDKIKLVAMYYGPFNPPVIVSLSNVLYERTLQNGNTLTICIVLDDLPPE
jgi:hypothetical protein